MSTDHYISVSGLDVTIVRKRIKNLHLGVYPPNGRIRVAAPLAVSNEAIRLAVVGKLGWIRKQQARFAAQPRQSQREMIDGESHYYLGQRYRLRIAEGTAPVGISLPGGRIMQLSIRPNASIERRQDLLQQWYRQELRKLIPPLLAKWEPQLGVEAAEWRIKRMKTRWGTCNTEARRVWLNLELIKKPEHCLEYVVVHELAHLLERKHDARFVALLDQHLPLWRSIRAELNDLPLAAEM